MKIPEPRKLKSGNYFIQLRLNGVSVPVTASTAKECKRQAELIKAEHRAGKRQIKTAPQEKTLEQLLADYIASRKKVLSPSTLRGYTTIKDTRFRDYIGRKPSEITDWQKVISDETESGVSAKTVKNSWSMLASALNYAGLPVPDVTLPMIASSERPWLDAGQIKTFVAAVHWQTCEIPALLALHSLRRSEIMGLTWDKIDLKKDLIRIEGSAVFNEDNKLTYKDTNKSKNSRRVVPIMIPELKAALLAIPEEKRTGHIMDCNPNTIWAQINRVCEASGLPKVGVHGLRHSFASLAHHVGLPEQDAMLIGGWEDAQTMHKIYTHIENADKLKYENKIADFFKNANENANHT